MKDDNGCDAHRHKGYVYQCRYQFHLRYLYQYRLIIHQRLTNVHMFNNERSATCEALLTVNIELPTMSVARRLIAT